MLEIKVYSCFNDRKRGQAGHYLKHMHVNLEQLINRTFLKKPDGNAYAGSSKEKNCH